MSKKTIIIITIILCVIAFIWGFMDGFLENQKNASNLNVSSAADLTALVDKIYEGVSIEMPMLMTQELDMTDVETVKYFTGLENIDDIEYVVASEPMMTSQAYSLMLVKVKDGADAEAIAKSMNENVDERKWICVTAEKIYSVASGDVVCLVMSNEQTAKTVYDSFKTLAGSVGQEFERTAEEPEMPDDMLPGADMLPAEDGNMEDDTMNQPAAM